MTHSDDERIMVIGPDGQPLAAAAGAGGAAAANQRGGTAETPDDNDQESVTDMVEQPAKVMRIGTMIKQLLEEVRAAPLDDASRNRLKEIHRSSIRELEDGLAPELRDELERLTLPFTEDTTPSDAELRIAQAQLVGWLEGLFHGIQTALFAQQMAARAQLEQMRQGALPPGLHAADPRGQQGHGHSAGTGQYL
ncbi:bacterial proteasome activator family protein [Skermania sp. ID1734]|uniref:bacterial proteasome activator family protein n=1 Tax=Skermania sp. ID1734 TaxID=2597516 RepID=UPI00117C5C62|nr:bacterial proteasome activator family protein [Skermania sp. ID1734]TSE00704.1 bacterial proteasome activator family protein [Skermania sp. ID1734]